MRSEEDQKLIDLLTDTLLEVNMIVSGRLLGDNQIPLSERLMHVIQVTDGALMDLPPPTVTEGNTTLRTQYLQWRREIDVIEKRMGRVG